MDKFISVYNDVIKQKGILWNITMGLNWIRPFTFINLDTNNRNTLSSDEIFSDEFKNEIKSLSDKTRRLLSLPLLRTHRVPFDTMGSSMHLSSKIRISFIAHIKIINFIFIIRTIIMFYHNMSPNGSPFHFN